MSKSTLDLFAAKEIVAGAVMVTVSDYKDAKKNVETFRKSTNPKAYNIIKKNKKIMNECLNFVKYSPYMDLLALSPAQHEEIARIMEEA